MRQLVWITGLALTLCACDTGQKVDIKQTKTFNDLKQTPKAGPKELEDDRRSAGFPDKKEIENENVAAMRKGEREYVKTRLAEHRAMLKGVRGLLDRVEKTSPKWPKAKDPQKTFDKFASKYREDAKALVDTHKKFLEGGGMQIDIQAKLVGVFRSFEVLNGDLGPEISAEEGLATALADLRKALDEVDAEFEVIEKDDNLRANPNYKPEGKG
ncbi:MAG: hypothetical protein K0V04_37875 [Deltaproteobacteria bacterium]|nr:hypothetical protein [Deltaproteobacteria bacterium]